jgi:hypothetical protein
MISKLQYWSEHVRELERQGVTLASYARENDLSKSQFVYWRQKIQNMNSGEAGFEEVQVIDAPGHGAVLNLTRISRGNLYAIIQALVSSDGGVP